MTTINREFTKEQLIERCRGEIECAQITIRNGTSDTPNAVAERLELFEIALASLEAEKGAEPVAFINGAWTLVYYRPPKELGLKIGDKLYTAPPAQMLEIENLEHFISFWKKVQAGQMKPGKNDIDHMVWFLEGLSNLTAPPAPVVPEEMTMADAIMEIDAKDADRWTGRIGFKKGWNACRDAMLHGKAEPVSNRDELPVSEIECDICGFKSTDPDGAHYCCEDNSND